MLKSSGAMGIATLSSRVLGMLREMAYAWFMGDGVVAGAFKMAFMIPNLFRRLLGEGALTAAFIPIFKEKEKRAGEAEMWRAANAVISALLVVASVIVLVVMLGLTVVLHMDGAAPGKAQLAAAGWEELQVGIPPDADPAGFQLKYETRLMLELTRVMFPYLIVICLTAIFMGILNARGHFFVPAMGTTVLNLVLIATVLILAPRFGKTLDQQIFAVALGVLFAGLAQAAFQLPVLFREGFHYRWIAPFRDETVREVARKMVPGMLGVAAFQLNVFLTQGIAFAMSPTIVASFDYAVRLMELPQGIFGISLATYLLPALSGLAADKNYSEFRSTLRQGLGYLSFANLLASVLLVVLAEPIVRLIFEHGGKFGPEQTARAAFALACLAPGLVAFSANNILARAFYALGDMQTPMKISAVCLMLNVVFSFAAIGVFAQGGLGLANTLSAGINSWLLFYALRRKLARLDLAPLRQQFIIMAAAAVAAGAVAWFGSRSWETWVGHASLFAKAGAVFVPTTLAALLYLSLLLWQKIPSAQDYWRFAMSKLNR